MEFRIWAMGCTSPRFDRNEVAYTAVQVKGGQTFLGDSQAFDVDHGCSGAPCIEYNYSHDNGGGFLLVMPDSPAETIRVRYNVSVNDGRTNCGKNTTLHRRGQAAPAFRPGLKPAPIYPTGGDGSKHAC